MPIKFKPSTIIGVIILIVVVIFIGKAIINWMEEYYGVIRDCKKGIHRLTTTFPENCDYEEIKLIGKGEKADVYSTMCNNKEYAMKVTTSYNPDSFQSEVFNQIAVGSTLSPSVLDAFTCDNKKGYIVMDRLYHTVTEYIRSKETDPTKRIALVNYFRTIAKNKFKEASDKGFYHSDTHIDNMMVKEDQLGKPDLYFIDWGVSERKFISQKELQSKFADLDQTFDLLVRTINTTSTKTPAAPKKVQKTRQIFSEQKEESPLKKVRLPGFQTDSKINPIDYSTFKEVKEDSTPIKPFSTLQFDSPSSPPTTIHKLSFDDEPTTPPRTTKKMLSFDDDDDSPSFLKRATIFGEESINDYPKMPSSPF